MCTKSEFFQNQKVNISVYTCVILLFAISSFIYWCLFMPLIYIHLYQAYDSVVCIILYWVIGFILWCPIMITTLLIMCYLKQYSNPNNADYPLNKSDEYIKNIELKDHVKKRLGITESINSSKSGSGSVKENGKPGLLTRLSTKIRKEDIVSSEPEITALPDFNPHQSIFQLTSLNATEPAEVFRTESPIPFHDHLHMVQIESPSTPNSLKSPREHFFHDLYEKAAQSHNETSYFNFEENDNEESHKKADHVFIGNIGRQDSVTSEIFIPIDENGLIKDEPTEFGKYEVLKEKQ